MPDPLPDIGTAIRNDAMTDAATDSEEQLAAQLAQLRSRNETQGGAAAEACMAFSRRVLKTHPRLGCQALQLAYWAFMVRGEFVRAHRALEQAAVVARRHKLEALQARVVLMRMEMLLATGEHHEGFAGLVDFTRSAQFSKLSVNDSVRAFYLLACGSSYFNPGDGCEACLELADQRVLAAGQPLAPWFVLMRALLDIQRLIWAAPCFETNLLRRVTDPRFLEVSRARLRQDCATLLAMDAGVPDQRNPRQMGWIVDRLYRALESASSAPAIEARQELERLARKEGLGIMAQLDLAYLITSTFLCVDELELAERHVAAYRAQARQAAKWELRLVWPFLESAIAQRQGRLGEALQHFQEHAVAYAAHVPRLYSATSRMLDCLMVLNQDTAPRARALVPEYLARALACLEAKGGQVRVSDVASSVGVSERTLRTAFRMHLGISPLEHAQKLRLDAARGFLSGGESVGLALSDIAPRFGFANAGRFSRAYRARFGRSPNEDRGQTVQDAEAPDGPA